MILLLMKKKQIGEIATILVVGSLILASIISFSSSLLFTNRQSNKAKATDITYKCRTDSVDWVCIRDNHKADQQAKDAFCGFYASLITENGNNYVAVINKWREEHEKNMGYNTGDCGRDVEQPTSAPIPTGGGGDGCFYISADFEVRDEGDKKAFYAWVTFNSQRGGDIKLEYNGINVAGWNRFGGGSYTYSPQWTQPHTHDYDSGIAALTKGQEMSFTYRGMHSGCSPQDVTITCSIGYRSDGSTYVAGQNCSCRNCQTVQIPTLTPTRSLTLPPRTTNIPTPTPINAGNLCEQKQGECILRNLDCNITLGNNYKETNDFELNDSCGSGKKCCLPRQTDRQTPTPTKTPIPTLTPTPTPTPTLTLKPTQPLISDTGIWSDPGRLYIENINNDKTIRIIVVSLVGNYDQINEEILPRQHIVYYYSKLCNLVRRRLSGYIAYYSSEDNYNMAHFKEINVSCNSYLVVGLK
jgi:hypothetical protein